MFGAWRFAILTALALSLDGCAGCEGDSAPPPSGARTVSGGATGVHRNANFAHPPLVMRRGGDAGADGGAPAE